MSISSNTFSTPATNPPQAVPSPIPVPPQPQAAGDSQQASDEPVLNRRTLGAFGTSLTVHLLMFLVMAFIVLPGKRMDQLLTIFSADPGIGGGEGGGTFEVGLPDLETDEPTAQMEMDVANVATSDPRIDVNVSDIGSSLPAADVSVNADAAFKAAADGAIAGPGSGSINVSGRFGGRSEGGRAQLARAGGGSAGSEAAVEEGLKWLQRHQKPDGSWSFDHVTSITCGSECTQPGFLRDCHTGATAMALLAFLGAGHTPDRGKYRREVAQGIDYLIRNMDVGENGGDLQGEGSYRKMYVHGLAAIALCEAHAMTRTPPSAEETAADETAEKVQQDADAENDAADKMAEDDAQPLSKAARRKAARAARKKNSRGGSRATRPHMSLAQAAQYAIDFVMYAQDPQGGGWRYVPRENGDTSAVGWQLMALESARAGDLKTQPRVFERVTYFLNSVQAQRGAQYGYMTGETGRHGTTAIGLLCRMYLGWDRENPALQRGVEVLSDTGPDFGDMYYNYYATQVMHHWGGEHWERWNGVMRDHLVETQITRGHAAGSWDVADNHGHHGGRLYMTCLCIMTLEVYYRHLPLYQREAITAQ